MCCDELIACPIQENCICSLSQTGKLKLLEKPEEKLLEKPEETLLLKLDLEWCWLQLAPQWICLNLKDRTDRFQIAATHMHEVGLCRITKFLQSERPHKHEYLEHVGPSGCWNAHVGAARQMVVSGQAGGFFEDDFKVIYASLQELRDRLLGCIEEKFILDETDQYDCLMFGGLIMSGFPISKETLFAPRVYAACTHAYIATPSMIRTLAETPYILHAIRNGEEEPLDWFYIHHFRQHMFVPQFVVQRIPDTNVVEGKGKGKGSLSDVKKNEKRKDMTLLQWLEQHMAEPTLRFVEHHSQFYDITMLVVLPIILLAMFLMMAWYTVRGLWKRIFGGTGTQPTMEIQQPQLGEAKQQLTNYSSSSSSTII